MTILYAPSARESSDTIHNNVGCGLDVMILETLQATNNEVLYLPHKDTSETITRSIVEIFGDSISLVHSPQLAEICVSDVANFAIGHAIVTGKLSVLCLFGFSDISFPTNDKYYELITKATHIVHSLAELKAAILSYDKLDATQLQAFQQETII